MVRQLTLTTVGHLRDWKNWRQETPKRAQQPRTDLATTFSNDNVNIARPLLSDRFCSVRKLGNGRVVLLRRKHLSLMGFSMSSFFCITCCQFEHVLPGCFPAWFQYFSASKKSHCTGPNTWTSRHVAIASCGWRLSPSNFFYKLFVSTDSMFSSLTPIFLLLRSTSGRYRSPNPCSGKVISFLWLTFFHINFLIACLILEISFAEFLSFMLAQRLFTSSSISFSLCLNATVHRVHSTLLSPPRNHANQLPPEKNKLHDNNTHKKKAQHLPSWIASPPIKRSTLKHVEQIWHGRSRSNICYYLHEHY